MPVIDADAHVVETERTWDFMEPGDQKYRPVLLKPGDETKRAYWQVDGKVCGQTRPVITSKDLAELSGSLNRNVANIPAARDLEDVGVRLRHMDQLGVDIQVLHSSIFIERVAVRAETEIAVCKGWNRWLADVWKQGGGRLLWSCVLPLLTMDAAVEELKFCKQHGACAVFLRAIEGERLLYDPYFYPMYDAASRLNMAMVVHVAVSNPYYLDLVGQYNGRAAGFWKFRLPTMASMHSLLMSEVPKEFPELRWGFLESGSEWIPLVVKDILRRTGRQGTEQHLLRDNRVYVACETIDDLPYVMGYSGEDNIVIGTDYGHTDPGTEIDAITVLRRQEQVSPDVFKKIVDDNARALYGL